MSGETEAREDASAKEIKSHFTATAVSLPSALCGVGRIVSVFPNTGHTSIKVGSVLHSVTQVQRPWRLPQTSALQPPKQAQEKRVSQTLHQTEGNN